MTVPETPPLWRRVIRMGVCALVVAILLPSLLVFWATAVFLMNSFLIGSHIRATLSETIISVLFSTASFIVLCFAVGSLTALLLRDFGDENRRASLRIAFGLLAGAIAGTLASGVLTVSLRSGPFGLFDPTREYWLWGPTLALAGGMAGLLLERIRKSSPVTD